MSRGVAVIYGERATVGILGATADRAHSVLRGEQLVVLLRCEAVPAQASPSPRHGISRSSVLLAPAGNADLGAPALVCLPVKLRHRLDLRTDPTLLSALGHRSDTAMSPCYRIPVLRLPARAAIGTATVGALTVANEISQRLDDTADPARLLGPIDVRPADFGSAGSGHPRHPLDVTSGEVTPWLVVAGRAGPGRCGVSAWAAATWGPSSRPRPRRRGPTGRPRWTGPDPSRASCVRRGPTRRARRCRAGPR